MNKFFQIFGTAVFILGIGYSFFYLLDNFQIFDTIFKWFGILCFLLLVLFIIFKIRWHKKGVIRGTTESFIGGDFVKALNQYTKELPNPSATTNAQLIGQGINRLTRIGIFTFLMALLPSLFLLLQTILLRQQNELFTFQNTKVSEQTELLNQQTSLLQSQNQKLDTQNELFGIQNKNVAEQTNLLGTQTNKLETQNQLFRFQNNKVSEQTALLNTQNEKLEYQNQRVTEQTDLFKKQNEKLDVQINLEESSRRSALVLMMSNIMDKVDEELTNDWNDDSIRNLSPQLIGRIAALSQSFRPYRFWQDSSLTEKPLSPEKGQLLLALVNSNLDSLTYDNIYGEATFEKAYLKGVSLNDAYLSGVDLRSADLSETSLSYTDLSYAHLDNTNLSYANLNGSNLNGAYFDVRKRNLKGTVLRYAKLSQVKIYQKEWLNKLKEWEIIGYERILKNYTTDLTPKLDIFGNKYYLIKPKS